MNYQTIPSRPLERKSSQETIVKAPTKGSKHSNSTDVEDLKLSELEQRRSTKKRQPEESEPEKELTRVESKAKILTSRKVLETIQDIQ